MIERTPSLREEQPNKQMRELMSVLADEWKSLSEAQKTVPLIVGRTLAHSFRMLRWGS